MAIDTLYLAKKIKSYRNQFKLSLEDVSKSTGINISRLESLENAEHEPTGDEILIIADFYKCDFKFFISNEKIEPLDETETLFRKYDEEFSISDRWAIQELLYLAECEAYLQKELGKDNFLEFEYTPKGNFYIQHAKDASQKLRDVFKYSDNAVPIDVFKDFRLLGIHIFRRRLDNSKLSGLFINHPSAGKCILINYSEDIFRQRFSVCHEVAHSIFDLSENVIVSFTNYSKDDLVEIRAENFASSYLLPPGILEKLSLNKLWTEEEVINISITLKVSTSALANTLYKNKKITQEQRAFIKSVKVQNSLKIDSEISSSLSAKGLERKKILLEKGLSSYYVSLCFDAYNAGLISAARISEMLLISEKDLIEIAKIFMIDMQYGS